MAVKYIMNVSNPIIFIIHRSTLAKLTRHGKHLITDYDLINNGNLGGSCC